MARRKAIRPAADAPAFIAAVLQPQYVARIAVDSEPAEPALAIPADWTHGALLNVRNQGDYVVTLFPEEYDYRHPERALRFPNPAECQNFVSNWYARESHDGRAF